MSAPIGNTSGEASAADSSAPAELSAQPSSEQSASPCGRYCSATVVVNRIARVSETRGWNPLACRLSDFLEAQLAELDRYRVAEVERAARDRENALSRQHPANRG